MQQTADSFERIKPGITGLRIGLDCEARATMERNLHPRIREMVLTGKLREPFHTKDIPFLKNSPSFLYKHPEYFERVKPGLFKLVHR